MTVLAATQVSVRRGERVILREVSVSAVGGEFVAVIGANGAGKSTLLSVLAGLLTPGHGQVCLDGVPLTIVAPRDLARRRAYLPQNPRCDWPIAVERLVALGLTPVLPAFGDLPPSFRPALEAALHSCDLLSQRQQPATTLSGGELARAMLARALVADPEILIVDEPTAGLDPRHALEAVARLRAVALTGKVVIAALHDLTLVARHATRVIALKSGAIVAEGPTPTTLTAQLLEALLDVKTQVTLTSGGPCVDYLGPAPDMRAV